MSGATEANEGKEGTEAMNTKRFLPYLLFLLFPLFLPFRSTAIELSLEENKAERGTVGFVDMDRVFKEYPETIRAKQQFEAEVSTRRIEIQRRKSELIDMRSDLARLQVDRERLLRESLTEPAVIPAAPPAVSTPAAPAVSTQTAPVPKPAPGASDVLKSLPGLTPSSSTAVSSATVVAVSSPTVAVSTPIAPPPQPPAAPPAPSAPAAPASPTPAQASAAQRLRDMDDKIAAKQKEIDAHQKAFDEFQAKAEADLLDLEKKRVQILLGKLYDIVQEVAKEEGVSVVVDKKAILFGQKAVDLTDKLLERVK